jgi:hypothetical protein
MRWLRPVALGVAALGIAIAGCGSQASAERASLGGIGLFVPVVRGDEVQVDVAVMTSFPNADDDHAERDRRFDWVSLRLGGRTSVASHESKMVDKTSDYVDTYTGDKSAWRDRWRVVLPVATFTRLQGRTPMTVRACDGPPADGVHCEQRTIDVCVRHGRLRGEVTEGEPPTAAPRGARTSPDYATEFSCDRPVFNGRFLDSISDPDPNPDLQ